MRECRKCKTAKPESEFRKNKRGPNGLAWWCKECTDSGARQQPSGQYHQSRWYKVLWQYGISKERYYEILDSQGGCCALCKASDPGRKNAKDDEINKYFLIDHDHSCCAKRSCGKCVRGLLCFKCNVLLSMARDDKAVLQAAIDYLDK